MHELRVENGGAGGSAHGVVAQRDELPVKDRAGTQASDEGGHTALVPALPGCVTYGRTVDEAREMAKDAIAGYIASLRKHKDPIPTDDDTLVASLDLEYSR